MPNWTFLDRRWLERKQSARHNPYKLLGTFFDTDHASKILPAVRDATSLYDYSAAFFGEAAEAVHRLSRFERGLMIELVVGEGFAKVDAIHLGTLQRGLDFPVLYDRVQTSNVPDYT